MHLTGVRIMSRPAGRDSTVTILLALLLLTYVLTYLPTLRYYIWPAFAAVTSSPLHTSCYPFSLHPTRPCLAPVDPHRILLANPPPFHSIHTASHPPHLPTSPLPIINLCHCPHPITLVTSRPDFKSANLVKCKMC